MFVVLLSCFVDDHYFLELNCFFLFGCLCLKLVVCFSLLFGLEGCEANFSVGRNCPRGLR